MAVDAEHRSNLSFAGNGDVFMWVKNFWVEKPQTNKTNKTWFNWPWLLRYEYVLFGPFHCVSNSLRCFVHFFYQHHIERSVIFRKLVYNNKKNWTNLHVQSWVKLLISQVHGGIRFIWRRDNSIKNNYMHVLIFSVACNYQIVNW